MDSAAIGKALTNVGKLKVPKKNLSAESQIQNGANAAYWGYKAFQTLQVRTSVGSPPHVLANEWSIAMLASSCAHTMHRVPSQIRPPHNNQFCSSCE